MKQFFKVILYQPLYNILVFLSWLVPGHSVGWAIIILTVLIRLALLPSGIKTARSQQKLKDLAPRIQEIKDKYKEDRQGEAQATMGLYKEHGVSPWGSCLPLLVQLPIIFILYRVFMNGLGSMRTDLLYSFTPHLNSVNTHWLWFDLAQPDKIVLPILAGLAQLVQSWQMKQLNPTPANAEKKKDDFATMLSNQMLFIMPIFTVIIAVRLPAALALYWIVTTLFMIMQTWLVTRGQKAKDIETIKEGPKQIEKELEKMEVGSGKNDEIESKPKKMSMAERVAKMRQPKPRKDVTVEIRRKD